MDNKTPYFTLYSFENVTKEFNDFLNSYYPIKRMVPPDVAISNLKPEHKRICRFCRKFGTEVTFNKGAHIIPEFLGNRFLISDFECDVCNSKFGEHETDFAAWLGAVRTILGTRGKNGIPKFKPFKDGINVHTVNFLNSKAIKISDKYSPKETIQFDKKTGEINFKFRKEAYTPIRVYKSFLKIALSMIDQSEIEQYKAAFDFLLGSDNNGPFRVFAKVICHELSSEHQVIKPLGILFKKIDPLSKIPLHFFLLYYENFIYGFPIPFNQLDIKNGCYGEGNMQVLFPPPILFNVPDGLSTFYNYIQDFSSIEKIKNEEQMLKLNMPLEIIKNASAYNPNTGESSNIEPSEIVGIYIVPEGTTIPLNRKFDLP